MKSTGLLWLGNSLKCHCPEDTFKQWCFICVWPCAQTMSFRTSIAYICASRNIFYDIFLITGCALPCPPAMLFMLLFMKIDQHGGLQAARIRWMKYVIHVMLCVWNPLSHTVLNQQSRGAISCSQLIAQRRGLHSSLISSCTYLQFKWWFSISWWRPAKPRTGTKSTVD